MAKTGGGPDDQSLRAICLDIKTGKTVWDQEVFSRNHVSTRGLLHSKNSHASPTPISDGKKLYVHFGTEGTAALDLASGRIAWKMQDLAYVPRHGNGGSPALVDGLMVVTCDGQDVDYVAAIDCRNGTLSSHESLPDGVDVMTHGRYPSSTRDDDTLSTHGEVVRERMVAVFWPP